MVEVTVLNVNDNVPVIGIEDFVKIEKDHDISKPIASLKVNFDFFLKEIKGRRVFI